MAEFEDDYPVLDTASAQPADDYPILDQSTIHASNVPKPPEDDYPVLNPPEQNRGIVERTKSGFTEHYEPLLTDAVKKIAPSFAEQHPAIAGVIQSALEKSPIGWADKAQAALFGAAPGAAAGVVAGAAEPLIGRSQADKLQSDAKTIIDMALIAPGLGWAGAAAHGRGAQLSDVGKPGLKQLNKQGQTAGSDAAAGVAQDPRPPAAEPVADPQNKATLGTGEKEVGGENLNTRDYSKKTEPSAPGEATGVNVGEVDPTLRQVLTPKTTLDAAQREKFSGLSDETLQDFSTRTDRPELQEQIRQELELRKQKAAPPAAAEVPAGTMELPPVEVRPAAVEPPPVREVRPEPAAPRPTAIEHDPMDMARRGELSAARAEELAQHYQNRDKQVVDAVLGKDADAWRRAHKLSDQYWNSGYNDAKARVQDKLVEALETKHPPEAIEAMYRKLEQSEHTDPQGWRDFARDLRDVEGSRENAVTTVGYTLRRLPEAGKALGQIDRETLAVIQHALDREAKRGGNPDAFLRDAFAKSSERYGGGADAAEIIAGDMARLKELMRNPSQERAVPALPAPKPVEAKPVRPPKAAEAIAKSKAAEAPALTKRQFEHKVNEAEQLRMTHGIKPKDPEVAAALAKRDAVKASREEIRKKTEAERAVARPEAPAAREESPLRVAQRAHSEEYTGKLKPELSAADYSRRMSELRDNKPRPIEKLWRDLSKAPPERVAIHRERIKTWDNEYAQVSKNQKLALERDNAAFREKQGTLKPTQRAPQETASGQAPPRITPETRPIEPTGRPVPEGARAEVNRLLDQTMSAENPTTHLRETAAKARELGLEGQARRIEQAVTELERQRDVQIAPGPGERSTGTLRQQQEGIVDRLRNFLTDERGSVRVPERLVEKARTAYNTLLTGGKDLINELQLATSPMAARSASNRARAIAKDQANAVRAIDQAWTVADNHIMRARDPITKKLLFDEASRKEMWERADQENVMRQRGETNAQMGINALKPHERALVESFQPKAHALWEQARDIGWVKGEGLPYYTPRLFEGIVKNVEGALALDAKGQNIQTTTSSMKRRKYLTAAESEAAAKAAFGDEAKIIRDIRTMPFTLAKMEKALVNRVMIKEIEAVGRRIGKETVIEGTSKPAPGWFTIPDNPAFYTYRLRYEKADTAIYRGKVESHGVVKVPDDKIPLFDRNGLPVLDRVPIWLPGEFEGPLRSIMTKSLPLVEQGLMAAKGKTMGLIMNSPAIHNMVEWGRAFPTMPGKMLTLQTYFEGNAAKKGVPYTGTARYVRDWATGKMEAAPRNASPIMMEAIDSGLVPIGKRFFNQDITAVMENPDLTPGRSITAKMLALVPDLYNSKAHSDAVKRTVDRAGDVWHNTLLWDRIGDLQMGLYVNAKRAMVEGKGVNEKMASYVAAHVANRYAGALPNEAMSNGARRIANFMMFSRTFTLGNLGVLKDMFTGLPRDVIAQIERDIGVLDPKAVGYAKSLARRKAMMAVGLDIGLMYILNSVAQSTINVLKGDNTLGEEGQGYIRRAHEAMQRINEMNPLTLLNPQTLLNTTLGTIESLSSTYENEPGKRERIMIGKTAEGRGVYVRNPVGKIGEEFVGYAAGPLDMAKRKVGTIVRPMLQMLANDKGFGEKIYDAGAEKLDGKEIETALAIAKQFFVAQTPEGQLSGLRDLATGQTAEKIGSVPIAALQAFGPVVGTSFSRGHPQGPAAGEYARMNAREKFEQQASKPEITKLIRNGKIDEAIERMNELGYPSGLRKALLNPHMSPRKFRDMAKQGTLEEQERFQRALERQ